MVNDATLEMGAEDRRRAEQLSLQTRRPPTHVPGYEPAQFLGKGAFGEVWVAINRNTGGHAAIKFYNNKGGLDLPLLSREVEKLRFLMADRHVVQLLNVGWDANPPYYIMEYVAEGSLEDHLQQGPLPAVEAVALFREVAVGLVHAHGKGILHCDLKPANILIDQDHKPRLADFGQSRLTHEHSPALGTLFYMAPEQADLKAIPDARWDVYALGAVLYRMLTGTPPYYSEDGIKRIKETARLDERLERYRQLIRRSPRPGAHRKVRGVDRALADIIDRCLAVNPDKRFPNVQAVLSALDSRAMQRARRPLLVLGVMGPALLLIFITFFARQGLHTSVQDSEQALTGRSLESNRFAARFVAETVARKITQRWSVLEREGFMDVFQDLLKQAHDKPKSAPERIALQKYLDTLHDKYPSLATSWFVDDADGTFLGSSPLGPSEQWIDHNFSFRDYFHGQGKNYTAEDYEHGMRWNPIDQVHQSVVFQSKSTGRPWVVVFSAPVWDADPGIPGRHVLAVLAMQIELGKFGEFQAGPEGNEPDQAKQVEQWAVLADRHMNGMILEHPRLKDLRQKNDPPEGEDQAPLYYWPLLQDWEKTGAHPETFASYYDPLDPDPQDRWLAAVQPVIVQKPETDANGNEHVTAWDTNWVVIVQERYADATSPVNTLKGKLERLGLMALVLLLTVVTVLWGFVAFALNDSSKTRVSAFLRRRAGLGSGSTSGGTGVPSSQNRSGAPGGLPSTPKAGGGSEKAAATPRTS